MNVRRSDVKINERRYDCGVPSRVKSGVDVYRESNNSIWTGGKK